MSGTPDDDASESNLPNLLVIGAMKAGTTTLWREFERIPDIAVAKHKETMLFPDGWDRASLAENAARDYPANGAAQYRVNFDTSLAKCPEFDVDHARIIEALGRPKLILMTREPVERLISQHAHWVRRGRANPDLRDALVENSWLVDFSRYAYQLEPWAAVVDDDDILVTSLERYQTDRGGFLAEIGGFLGVDMAPAQAAEPLQENAAAVGYGSLSLEKALTGSWYRRRVSPLIPAAAKGWVREHIIRPASPTVASGWDEVPSDLRDSVTEQFAVDRAEMIERWGIDPHTGMR